MGDSLTDVHESAFLSNQGHWGLDFCVKKEVGTNFSTSEFAERPEENVGSTWGSSRSLF